MNTLNEVYSLFVQLKKQGKQLDKKNIFKEFILNLTDILLQNFYKNQVANSRYTIIL
jgi:hypothetical protein